MYLTNLACLLYNYYVKRKTEKENFKMGTRNITGIVMNNEIYDLYFQIKDLKYLPKDFKILGETFNNGLLVLEEDKTKTSLNIRGISDNNNRLFIDYNLRELEITTELYNIFSKLIRVVKPYTFSEYNVNKILNIHDEILKLNLSDEEREKEMFKRVYDLT